MKKFGMTEEDMDQIRSLFTDTNPYLLLATLIVSVLHTVFELLAMKNDVSYWKKLESMKGKFHFWLTSHNKGTKSLCEGAESTAKTKQKKAFLKAYSLEAKTKVSFNRGKK